MKKSTRLTALLITVLMIVSMLPVFTFSISATTTTSNGMVAELIPAGATTGTQYATFQEAWEAAHETTGATLKLLANTSTYHSDKANRGARWIGVGKELTLDLNGYVLTPPTVLFDGSEIPAGKGSRIINVTKGTIFTVKDSRPDAVHMYRIEKIGNADFYVWDEENGTIAIPGGAMTGGRATENDLHPHGGAILSDGCRLTIQGGNFIGNKGGAEGGAITFGAMDRISSVPVITGGLFLGNWAHEWQAPEVNRVFANNIAGLWNKSRPKQYTADDWDLQDDYPANISGGTFDDKVIGINMEGYIATAECQKNLITPGYGFVETEGFVEGQKLYKLDLVTETTTDANGVTHMMQYISQEEAPTCVKAGKTAERGCIAEHEPGVKCDYKDGGEPIKPEGHNEVVVEAIAPTCIKKGKTEGSKCSKCNAPITPQEDVPALNHTPGEWTVIKEATEDAAGREAQYCTVCNEAIGARDIPALNSNTEAPAVTEAPTADAGQSEEGCASTIGGGIGLIAVAVLGGCMLRRKKED